MEDGGKISWVAAKAKCFFGRMEGELDWGWACVDLPGDLEGFEVSEVGWSLDGEWCESAGLRHCELIWMFGISPALLITCMNCTTSRMRLTTSSPRRPCRDYMYYCLGRVVRGCSDD